MAVSNKIKHNHRGCIQITSNDKNPSNRFNIDLSNFYYNHCFCRSIDEFYDIFRLENKSYSIILQETLLDLEIHYRDPRLIVFLFAGAKPKQGASNPFFMARGISSQLKATCIFISDPVFYLDENIKLGWYAGTLRDPLQKILPSILKFIIKTIGSERQLYFGGSGGGFASLYYSRFTDNSTSLIWNPQIRIQKYPIKQFMIIEQYAKIAYNCDRNNLHKFITTDLTEIYNSNNINTNVIVYMQNYTDHHVSRDLIPFLSSYGISLPSQQTSQWLNPFIYLHLTSWSDGHKPPPRSVLKFLITKFSNPDDSWDVEKVSYYMNIAEKKSYNSL